MTLYECTYGYFLLKGAIIAGAEAMESATDEYYVGMRDAYSALETVLEKYEDELRIANVNRNSEKGCGSNA